eukprot:CAMPEP_0170541878 /NCGR_PEP_ID=MMETSP0211-20121228/1482_1 /TAXON_ID=311385 /ORGANISM="Pseudokeronopsis sp., Strain OXSARD2" /LENGTH=142 /DNA_ID=CAMNT_0010844765 /DNA_START=353 /DNA_END=782 /DNA_ORIENTATION=-
MSKNFKGEGKHCNPQCFAEEIENGKFCLKAFYEISEKIDGLCEENEDYYFGLCYPNCEEELEGIGPICWSGCPEFDGIDCGAICTTSEELCQMMIREDGKSINVIDLIYEAEIKEHGHSKVGDIIEALTALSPDFDFGYCKD